MNSKLWIRKALTMSLTVAIFATYSMVALAADGKAAGEIVITGNSNSAVTVNGEAAKSGRTIFSSSTITTPADAGAIVNLGKAGKIELAANTTFSVSFDDKAASGSLTSGSVSVLSAAQPVSVTTLSGDVVNVNVGESATAAGTTASKAAPSNGHSMWPFYAALGGAIVLIIIAVTQDNNSLLGGGATTVSPIR